MQLARCILALHTVSHGRTQVAVAILRFATTDVGLGDEIIIGSLNLYEYLNTCYRSYAVS